MADNELPIVLYHYYYSPYAMRLVWYLTLRGIPYSQCLQPPTMPRPDLAKLGIHHRRIPILAFGRDVYLDTRLIIAKLEAAADLPPSARPPLGTSASASATPEHRALERLLQILVIDGGVFARAAQLIPPSLPLMRDPAFRRDRDDFFPGGLAPDPREIRPEALADIAAALDLLETTLLSDGRRWILGNSGGGPSLADLEAVWPFVWLTTLPGALPAERFSAGRYPRVWAWMERFQGAVAEAKKAMPQAAAPPAKLSGDQAAETVWRSAYREAEGSVDEDDGSGLRKGMAVTVWPLDFGSSGRDTGKLVGLDGREIVIEVEAPGSPGTSVRVHLPRHGFRIRPAVGKTAENL